MAACWPVQDGLKDSCRYQKEERRHPTKGFYPAMGCHFDQYLKCTNLYYPDDSQYSMDISKGKTFLREEEEEKW